MSSAMPSSAHSSQTATASFHLAHPPLRILRLASRKKLRRLPSPAPPSTSSPSPTQAAAPPKRSCRARYSVPEEIAVPSGPDNPGGSLCTPPVPENRDRKSTRLNSSHLGISYAVFC